MTEWINVADITPRIGYTATASQTAFTVPFVFFENSDLHVYQNDVLLTLDTDYTVTGAEDEDGGTVTLLTGATASDAILISRHVPIEQTTHIPPSGPLDIAAINIQISKLIAISQQLNDSFERSLRQPDSEELLDMELPAARENKILGFDSDGAPVAVLGPQYVSDNSVGAAVVESKAVAQVTTFDAQTEFLIVGGVTAAGDSAQQNYVRGLVSDVGAFADGAGSYWKPVTPTAVEYSTRATAAAALNSSSLTYIRTAGYTTDGDGGGALYKKVSASTAFIDTYVLTVTITGGSGYTNGTYRGIQMNATSGRNLTATVTVSGGAVTALDFSASPGNAYKVGETITALASQIGGTGSGFSATIATISSPTGSFVDAAGNRWQIVVDDGCRPRVEQFGAVADWTGSDSGTTENYTAFQNALFFAGRQMSGLSSDVGPAGDVLMCGVGAYRIKPPSAGKSLIVPFGVILEGVSGTVLKLDDTTDSGTHFITLGDPNTQLACFRTRLKNLSLRETATGGSAGTAMVFSNNVQDMGGLEDVYIYAKDRGGVLFTNGYGGASTVRLWNVSINWNSSTNPGVSLNYGTTMFNIHDLITGGPSSGSVAAVALSLAGTSGMYKIEGFHVEHVTTGISVNLTSGGMATVKNATGGSGVTNLISLASTNEFGNFSIEQAAKNGATTLVSNGQSGGTSLSTDVKPQHGIVFFNP